mgnify:CR=1 FL=1
MNIKFDKTDAVSGVLTLSIQAADYAPKAKKALNDFCKNAKMPGFRPGMVPMGLAKKMYGTEAKAKALELRELFGEDCYLELQDHGIADQQTVNAGIRKISDETGIPMVATNDVHYIKKSDADDKIANVVVDIIIPIYNAYDYTERHPVFNFNYSIYMDILFDLIVNS